MLCMRWREVLRSRPAGGGFKPPQAAVVKSHGGELAPRGCTGDEGRPLRAALQGEALNRLKLLEVERPQVVSVEEKGVRRYVR
jgi:hypothetical protein